MADGRMRLSDANVARLKPREREYTVRDVRVPTLGVRVRPGGSRSWVRRTGSGRVTLGPTALKGAEEARRECLALEAAAVSGEAAGNAGGAAERAPTFRWFVSPERSWRAARRARLKPATRHIEDDALGRQLLPAFGPLALDRIGRARIERWFDAYGRTAPGGANRALEVLRAILNHAVACGHIPANPAAGIRPNPRPRRTRFLSAEEIARLHAVREGAGGDRAWRRPQADIIRLLLLTGCRRNEIVRLQWREVDGDRLRLLDGKTGPRTVALNGRARAVIARQGRIGSPFVFPSPLDPGRPLNSDLPLWRLVRREAGLEDVRLHDLRHTFASQAVLHGVPLPVVAQLLGHRSVPMTMRYAHVADRDAEAAAERVGLALAAAMDGEPSETGPP